MVNMISEGYYDNQRKRVNERETNVFKNVILEKWNLHKI